MNLLKYLEPMKKNMPKRFSNLAFWRDARKFKDAVINALEYADSWGESIEAEQSAQNASIEKLTPNFSKMKTSTGRLDLPLAFQQVGADKYAVYIHGMTARIGNFSNVVGFSACVLGNVIDGISALFPIEAQLGLFHHDDGYYIIITSNVTPYLFGSNSATLVGELHYTIDYIP